MNEITTSRELRASRLAEINAQLADRHLKPLGGILDHTKGFIEFTGIKDMLEHNARFYTDVVFHCIFPAVNGKPASTGTFPVRFNANSDVSDGAVTVITLNGHLVFGRQGRPCLGSVYTECIRGFGEALDAARVNGELGTVKMADLPLKTVLRELGEEALAGAEIISVTHLGNIAENSGTHAVTPGIYHIEVSIDQEKLDKWMAEGFRGEENIALKVWTFEGAMSAIGTKIVDMHSIAALMLFKRYRDSLLGLTTAG